MSKLKIPFGLHEGRLLAPTDVPRGLACGCQCPGCGARLVANHPTRNKVKYFSHHATEGCSTGYETAMHLAAKQVLLDDRTILVPQVHASVTLFDKEASIEVTAHKNIAEKMVVLDAVQSEVRGYAGIVPDIVATVGKKLIFIEVAVTHFVEQEKLQRLEALGYATLEIDLSSVDEIPSMEDVKRLVLRTPGNRSWLVNPKQKLLQEQAQAEAEVKLQAGIEEVRLERKARKEANERYLRLPDEEKLVVELQAANVDMETVAPFIGLRTKGDRSFEVSNKVWQAAIYQRFIHNQQGAWVNSADVLDWLSTRFRVSEPFKDAPKIAIYYYLQALAEMRLITKEHAQNYEVRKDATGSGIPF